MPSRMATSTRTAKPCSSSATAVVTTPAPNPSSAIFGQGKGKAQMPRKRFDDTTGKHVEVPHTLDPSEVMKGAEWLLVECPLKGCEAKPHEPCKSIMGAHNE